MAEKYAHARVEKWADECWAEMGMFTVTFYGYRGSDGRLNMGWCVQ